MPLVCVATPPSKTLSRFKVSKTLNEHWLYNLVELGFLRARPTPHSSANSLRKSLQHTDLEPGCFSLPLIRDQKYYELQARLNGEGRVGKSVALGRWQLFSLLSLLDLRA